MQEKTQKKSLIKQNILKYLDFIGVSQYEFYQKTGTTRGILGQNNGISEENISRFLAYFSDVDANWLISGQGEMLRNDQKIGDISNSTIVGANVCGSGHTIQHAISEESIATNSRNYQEIIKKQQEQMGKLIDVINKLSSK
jgi:hypothetical protein